MIESLKSKNALLYKNKSRWIYVRDRSAAYNVRHLLIDIGKDKIRHAMLVTSPSNAILHCDIEHEFNWRRINNVFLHVHLDPVVSIVFENDDHRIVLGHDRLQIARLMDASDVGIIAVRGADADRYRIDLPMVVPPHLAGSGDMRIVSRELLKRAAGNPGYGDDLGKLDRAYTFQMLRLTQLFRANGFNPQATEFQIDQMGFSKHLPGGRKFEWETFEEKFKTLRGYIPGHRDLRSVRRTFRADPHMVRAADPSAHEELKERLCLDLRLLRAGYDQALEMRGVSRFTGKRVQSDPRIKTELDFLEQVALIAPMVIGPDEPHGRPINMVDLARIAMLSGANPANLWWSADYRRHELDFACFVGRLSNAQPAPMTPAIAQAAIGFYERAKNISLGGPEADAIDQTASMLFRILSDMCELSDLMETAEAVLNTRKPTLVRIA